jgi:hypothetical protein
MSDRMSLSDALRTLSAAHGPVELARAFRSLQGQARRARKAADAQGGTLAQTIQAALRIWDGQTADGLPLAERQAGLERTLRAAWPQTREWRYLCATCDDVGLIFAECPGNDHCGRSLPHPPHSYGAPCFCPKGVRFKEKPAEPGDFRQAGRSKPTRLGR